ncbi:MAG: hypothetical protein IPO27_01945 [Bacteroidetes bacterium]|nr:hypothetical protein [Bacteroidota bacterium]
MNKFNCNLLKVTAIVLACSCGAPTERENKNATDSSTSSTAEARQGSSTTEDSFENDTISKLQDQQSSAAWFRAPDGNVYKVELADEDGNLVTPQSYQEKSVNPLYCSTDLFLGIERKKQKSTFLIKLMKNYATVNALRKSFPSDSVMKNLSPPITTDSNSSRVQQEKRNVRINTAFIYAISREADNDFHVIVGDTVPFNAGRSIIVEIAGLPNPANASSDTIQHARTVFENFFGEKCSGAYSVFTPPIRATIAGTIFYDIGHNPGTIGTGIHKPNTSWEIHPISEFIFK